jgi:RNA polymerase sigma-70 factor (ECF subfamily)
MEDLTAEVRRALEEARTQTQESWAHGDTTAEQLATFVRQAGVSPGDLALRPLDLLLASACAAGDQQALDAFYRQYTADLGRFLSAAALPASLHADLRQRVWLRLFSGDSPKIRTYSGRGPLGAWVRVVAIRMAVTLRSEILYLPRETRDGLLSRVMAETVEPELALVQGRYRHLLESALQEALAGLAARDKAVLRLQLVEGLTLDEIAVVLRVHRATIARWLVAVRRVLLRQVCQRLSIDLGSTPSEARSLIEAVRDDLHLSLSRLLPAVDREAI